MATFPQSLWKTLRKMVWKTASVATYAAIVQIELKIVQLKNRDGHQLFCLTQRPASMVAQIVTTGENRGKHLWKICGKFAQLTKNQRFMTDSGARFCGQWTSPETSRNAM
ncbi:MAG: hypothetical protein KDC35_19585 [Acidobacteria bacterium]|nr:hypothetical protein [Acidobacteriota bacterium]